MNEYRAGCFCGRHAVAVTPGHVLTSNVKTKKITYSDQNAVQIHLLAPVHARAPEDVREAARVVHAQDVDVVFAAESLNESEVNLESHIFHIIVVVSGQDAQHHVIGITEQKS